MIVGPFMGTLPHQVPLVVLGAFALMFGGFLVDVMLWVLIDLGQPLDRMAVDLAVVCIQDFLPFILLGILELFGALPCRQCGISLSLSELWFIAWCVWCSSLLWNCLLYTSPSPRDA